MEREKKEEGCARQKEGEEQKQRKLSERDSGDAAPIGAFDDLSHREHRKRNGNADGCGTEE